MRGRTWQFNVNQIAATLAGADPKKPAKAVAKKAADIVDAVYAEQKERNAVEAEAAYNALGIGEVEEEAPPTLHSAADVLGETEEE